MIRLPSLPNSFSKSLFYENRREKEEKKLRTSRNSIIDYEVCIHGKGPLSRDFGLQGQHLEDGMVSNLI